jgi:hypothetical protein
VAQAKGHQETPWLGTFKKVLARLRVKWDYTNWTDETTRFQGFQSSASIYDQGRGLPGLGFVVGSTAYVTLDNHDNRFSPKNANSPLHASITNGLYRQPVEVSLWYETSPADAAYVQFTGLIERPNEWEGSGERSIQVTCTDASIQAEKHTISTRLYTNIRADDYIAALLTEAGLTNRLLDSAMTTIPFAWLDDEAVWPECRAVAEADGGVLYVSKEGQVRYERQTHWLEGSDHTTSQATLIRGRTKQLETLMHWANCYDKVLVEFAPRSSGPLEVAYTSPTVLEVRPGETRNEVCRLRTPVTALISPTHSVDYQAISAGMADMHSSVTIGYLAGETYAQRATVSITNNHSYHSAFITGLQLRGYPARGDDSQEREYSTSLARSWPDRKTFTLRGNPYIQTREQAERLAKYLRDRLQYPRTLYMWEGPACPWLEIGDRVTLTDEASGVAAQDCYVLGINQAFQARSFWNMTLTLLPVTDLFPYASYFQLGTDTWGSPRDPLFY